ncbi:hypothetical protein [Methylocystis sp. SC2]|uniref:hypothetical protein n=1 Tax=Methylocystis sp. (strain SC2) TaxID=187303 RepID=UPI000318922C|nr:hypothetical protein [Methylocystis sp. SC2]
MSFLHSLLTEQQFATLLFSLPFLALCVGGLIAQYVAIRSELARLRRVRVPARRAR